jgi:pimeloyl-ACP methyl ester carboxylesterase
MKLASTLHAQVAVRAAVRLQPPRLAILLAATALLALSLLSAAALAQRAAASRPQPTIVLVHGAWAGPSGWNKVVAGLSKAGYATATPRLNLMTLAEDVATVRATLDSISGDKILVGHSYGGFVVSNAAFGRSDVRGLVYTAAFVPDEGDSIISLGEGYQPPAALPHLVFTGEPFASPAYIDPAFFPQVFAQDLNPKLAAALSDAQQPVDLATFFTPSGPVAWHALPSWYAVSGADRIVDPALQRALAQRIGASTVEFDDASHAGGFTHYAARFVKLVEQAVQATAD